MVMKGRGESEGLEISTVIAKRFLSAPGAIQIICTLNAEEREDLAESTHKYSQDRL